MRVLKVALGALVLLVLTACAGQGGAPAEGYPRAYAVGFDDGCQDGKQATRDDGETQRADNPRLNNDPTYGRGYNDGYERCERSEKAFARHTERAQQQKRMESEFGRGIPLKDGKREELETPPKPKQPQ